MLAMTILGTASAGQRFDVESTSSAGFHYGRYRGTSNWCTWILPSVSIMSHNLNCNAHALTTLSSTPRALPLVQALNTANPVSVASSCSTTTQSTLCNRQAFGVDFDAPPHQGDGAIIIPLDLSGCTGYYNYFVVCVPSSYPSPDCHDQHYAHPWPYQNSDFTSGAFQDPVPFALPASGGGYRYSSRDRVASMVRAPIAAYGGETVWFWVPRSCIAAQLAGKALDNSGGDSC